MRPILLLILLLFSPVSPAGTDARAYENELIGRLTELLPDSEFVWLQAEGTSFAGLYRQSDRSSGRVVILLHGMGAHADWPGIISSLRTQLPERGWSTLSVQLPVLPPQQSLADYGTVLNPAGLRIRSALNYLRREGYENIILVGYGFGASLAVNYLAGDSNGIRAFAGISMQEFPFLDPPLRLMDRLAGIKVPALDIYGSEDYPGVLRSVDDRRLAANRAGNNHYRQQVIETDHYFTGHQGQLVGRIIEWLDATVPATMPARMQSDPFYML